jgi:hypothetical protein
VTSVVERRVEAMAAFRWNPSEGDFVSVALENHEPGTRAFNVMNEERERRTS